MNRIFRKFNKKLIVLLLIGIAFFMVYSFLGNSSHIIENDITIYNSPDATANYTFSKVFYESNKLSFKDEANNIAGQLVSPRSMRVINGLTVPASFLGMPLLYGLLSKAFGLNVIDYLTPFMAVLGVIIFYFLIKLLFNKRIAFWSAIFLFINPAFWFYSTKSMMPNILFITLFLFTLYFSLLAIKKRKIYFYLLGAIFLALTLMVRSSSLVWILPIFIILGLFNYQRLKWKYIILSLLVFLITFSPILYFNLENYGHILSIGYDFGLELEDNGLFDKSLSLMQSIFLPFGFHPKTALSNIIDYTFKLFPLWSILSLIGLLIFSFKSIIHKKYNELMYLFIFLIISCYLIIYYGSWEFHDNPDPNLITIGTSYVRYFLPIYIFLIPMVIYSISNIYKKQKYILPVVSTILFIILGWQSYQVVVLSTGDGLKAFSQTLSEYQVIAQEVNTLTESDAIIISDRLDKVFFPSRSVIFKLNNDNDYMAVANLIEAGYPVYYFYFTRSQDQLNEFNQKYFTKFNLKVGDSLKDFEEQSLYPINKL